MTRVTWDPADKNKPDEDASNQNLENNYPPTRETGRESTGKDKAEKKEIRKSHIKLVEMKHTIINTLNTFITDF